MKYRILLLDADGTLFDFKKAEARGIKASMKLHGLPFNETILQTYSQINVGCWEEFERGLLDKETLLVERFRRLFDHFGWKADAAAMQQTYHTELGKGAYLLDGAWETCEKLRQYCALYIVTNGVSATQRSRLAASGLDRLVEDVFISEDIGCPKPQKAYFDRIFAKIPDFEKSSALIVGDSLTADIRGGLNAGIDTCWVNAAHQKHPEDMKINYEIRSIRELPDIVLT